MRPRDAEATRPAVTGRDGGLRPRVRRHGPVDRRPLFRERRQGFFLAGDALDRQGIDRDGVQPRKEVPWPDRVRLAVFLHQPLAEQLLGFAIFRDADSAEQDHAAERQPAIAFEAAIVEYGLRLVDFEADPRLPPHYPPLIA